LVVCALVAAGALSGCAGNGGGAAQPQPSGNTQATLLITADNNAKIPNIEFDLVSVTLLKTDGTSAPLLTIPRMVELGSLNGVARPLVTVTVPQGLYTSVEFTYGPSTFVVIDESGGPGLTEVGHYNFGATTSQGLTVKAPLTSALTVTGDAMGILLNLNIAKSITYTPFLNGSNPNIQPGGGGTNFTPTYSLTGVTIAAQPSTVKDGMVEDVHGQVSAISAGMLTITSEDGATLDFDTSGSTVFAGTSGTMAPAVGSYVDVDAALQMDGSMLATRVQAEGTQPYDLVGQIGEYHSQYPYITNTAREQQGPNLPNEIGLSYVALELETSSQFVTAWPNGTAPTGLPFTPTFDASSIATGQNIAAPLDALQATSTQYPVVNTMTLEPQTIDATVTAVASANGVTTYEVSLFPNDLMAILGTTPDVTVYATAVTHTITTAQLTGGMVGRFRGLLFNDGGTLKMVASEVEDGVPGS
jgi:hypothetical protein